MRASSASAAKVSSFLMVSGQLDRYVLKTLINRSNPSRVILKIRYSVVTAHNCHFGSFLRETLREVMQDDETTSNLLCVT